ncbi:transposable element Tcb2 transposase [Trichonephila clavipes]|nr:transposable element Tcb2 transposase [Trichonephila clavipes]
METKLSMKVRVWELCKRLEMQRVCALRIAGRGRLTSFSVENETGSGCPRQTSRECPEDLFDLTKRPSLRKKFSRTANCSIGCNPGTGSTFTRDPVPSRTIRRRLAEGHLGSRRPLRVLSLTPTLHRLHLEWCRARGNWTAAEWNQAFFNDESRFNRSSDDNRVRVWRPCGERLNSAFVLQRHTTPTAGVME